LFSARAQRLAHGALGTEILALSKMKWNQSRLDARYPITDLDGDILMARKLELEQMVDYVASDVVRGGAWNYKIAISAAMTAGADLTEPARLAIRRLQARRE
jgi:hypothetical protein